MGYIDYGKIVRENYKGLGITRIDEPILPFSEDIHANDDMNIQCDWDSGYVIKNNGKRLLYKAAEVYTKPGRDHIYYFGDGSTKVTGKYLRNDRDDVAPYTLMPIKDGITTNSEIAGIKGFTEFKDGKMLRTGVYVSFRTKFYVMTWKERKLFHELNDRWNKCLGDEINSDGTVSPDPERQKMLAEMQKDFDEFNERPVRTYYSYSSLVFDKENHRVYVRRSGTKKDLRFVKSGPTFRSLVYTGDDVDDVICHELLSVNGCMEQPEGSVWPELVNKHGYVMENTEKKIHSYLLSSIEKNCADFEDYVELVRRKENAAGKEHYTERCREGLPFKVEGEKESEEEKEEREEISLKWKAAEMYFTESGLPVFGKDIKELTDTRELLKKAYDRRASSFHIRYGENIFEKVSSLYPDYPMTKMGKKMLAENPYLAVLCWSTLKRLGKTDVNDLIVLYDSNENRYKSFGRIILIALGGIRDDMIKSSIMKEAKEYLKTRSIPKLLMDKMSRQYFMNGTMRDAFVMYHDLKNNIGEENCIARNGKPFCKLDIKEMHDEASFLGRKYEHRNVTLSYSDAVKKRLNIDVGHYAFRLAEDSYKIVKIGQTLMNCVGSMHLKPAVDGDEHIMYAKDKNTGEIRACISLTRNYKTLMEMKGMKNLYLEGDLAEAAKEWLKKAKVSYEGNPDVTNFNKHTTAFGDPRDFHMAEIVTDENGEEVYVENIERPRRAQQNE